MTYVCDTCEDGTDCWCGRCHLCEDVLDDYGDYEEDED